MTPFKGQNKVTSPYGYRQDPFGSGKTEKHSGIDVTAPDGEWTVRETTGGTVVAVSRAYNSGRGWLVKVQSGKAIVISQHLNDIYVSVGQTVRQGDALGLAGTTGNVTGRHLHFEVQVNGTAVEPSAWLGLANKAGTYAGNDDLDQWSIDSSTQPEGPQKEDEEDLPIEGIDVSKYQGDIDWAKVAASGKKFAFIRYGWAGYDGHISDGLDPYFAANMKGAIAAGIDVGVYVYSYAKTPDAAKIAAQETVQAAKAYRVAYPIVLDFEDGQYASASQKAANTEIAKAFLKEVEALGYYAMLYTYTNFAQNYLDMPALKNYDFWVADYRGYVGYAGAYGVWQTSSTGQVSGIAGNVDLNKAYKNYAAIIENAKLNGLSMPPQPKPAMYMVTAGPMSAGDKASMQALAESLLLPVTATEV